MARSRSSALRLAARARSTPFASPRGSRGKIAAPGEARDHPRHVADLDGHDRGHACERLAHCDRRALVVGGHKRHVDRIQDEGGLHAREALERDTLETWHFLSSFCDDGSKRSARFVRIERLPGKKHIASIRAPAELLPGGPASDRLEEFRIDAGGNDGRARAAKRSASTVADEDRVRPARDNPGCVLLPGNVA